jgi:hypothetical protein
MMAEHLTNRLLPLFNIEPGEMWFAYDNCVPDDQATSQQAQISLYTAGLITLNEARAELELDSTADGDTFKPAGAPPQDLGGGFGSLFTMPPMPQVPKSKAARAPGIVWTPAQEKIIRSMTRNIQKWVKENATAMVELGSNKDATRQQLIQQFINAVEGNLSALFETGASAGLAKVGQQVEDALSVIPERAIDFLSKYNVRLANQVTDTILEDIKLNLASALQDGSTPAERNAAVAEALGSNSGFIGERIARTESTRAYVQGNIEAWRTVGAKKKWLLSADPCPICSQLAEKFNGVYELDTPFLSKGDTLKLPDGKEWKSDYEDLVGPPAHPYCRCDLEPVLE